MCIYTYIYTHTHTIHTNIHTHEFCPLFIKVIYFLCYEQIARHVKLVPFKQIH